MAELLEIARSEESSAVRLSAIRDALDRAGLGASRQIDVEVSSTWEGTFDDIVLVTRAGASADETEQLRREVARLEKALERAGRPDNVVPLTPEDYLWTGSRGDDEFTPPSRGGESSDGPRSRKADMG